MAYKCPVCGYPKLEEKPRTKSRGGSYEICPSCGFQFGVSDDDAGHTYAAWRENWLSEGMKWSSRSNIPSGRDPVAQLANVRRRPAR